MIEQETDHISGFTASGAQARGVMAAVQVAMIACLSYTALRDVVLTRPTMAEGLAALLSTVPWG